jgi:hypothetical protein
MAWDFSSLTNVGWIITTVLVVIGLIIGIRQKPKVVKTIVRKSSVPNPAVIWGLLGFIVGAIIGSNISDGEDNN